MFSLYRCKLKPVTAYPLQLRHVLCCLDALVKEHDEGVFKARQTGAEVNALFVHHQIDEKQGVLAGPAKIYRNYSKIR